MTNIDPLALRHEILSDASEDYHGLYEVIWHLNSKHPDAPETEKIAASIPVMADLIETGLVELYKTTWASGKYAPISLEVARGAVLDPGSWGPPSENESGNYVCFASTEAGDREYEGATVTGTSEFRSSAKARSQLAGALTLAAGLLLILIGAQALGLVWESSPSIFAPEPVLLFLCAGHIPLAAVVGLPALVFWAWAPGLFRGAAQVPTRSVVLLISGAFLSALYFARSWHEGVTHQGKRFTLATALLSGVLILLAGALVLRSRKRPSFRLNLVTHLVIFGWLVSYAFPYLGEGS